MFPICRLCLSPSYSLENIFTYEGDNGVSILECISSFFSIEVQINDSLPKEICDKCLQIIIKVNKFRKVFLKNNEILHSNYMAMKENFERNYMDAVVTKTMSLQNLYEINGYNSSSAPSSSSDDESEYTSSDPLNCINDPIQASDACSKISFKRKLRRKDLKVKCKVNSLQLCSSDEEHIIVETVETAVKQKLPDVMYDDMAVIEKCSPPNSNTVIISDDENNSMVSFKSCKISGNLKTVNLEPKVLVNKLNEYEVHKQCDLHKICKSSENSIKLLIQLRDNGITPLNEPKKQNYIKSKIKSVYFNSQWNDFERSLYGKKTDVDCPTPELLLLSEREQICVLICDICNKIFDNKAELKVHTAEHKKKSKSVKSCV